MSPKVIEKTIALGKQRWRINEDGSWSVLMFGSFPFQKEPGLIWRWVSIEAKNVPTEVKNAV